MRRQRLVALLLAAAVAGGMLACSSSDGRELPPPRVLQTTTTPSAPVIQPSPGSSDVFMLTSASFAEGAEIPEPFTCRGASLSPALTWSGTPLDTTSLALVVRDRNAAGFVHWVVTGIDPYVLGIGEDGLPETAVEGLNSAGTTGWIGPCPPAGSGLHNYEFMLLALAEPVTLAVDTPAEQAAATLEEVAIERAVLTGTVTAD